MDSPKTYQSSYGAPDSVGGFFDQGALGWIDDFHGDWLFGDSSSSSDVIDELLGINSQKREFAQQEYLMDKQNAYNHPAAQMERMKEAGINPLTAAGGIAGNGNQSANPAAVSNNTGGPASGVSAASSLIGSIAQSKLSSAESENQRSQANKNNAEIPWIAPLSHARRMELFGNFAKSLTEAGNEEIAAGGLAFDLLSGGLQSAVQYLSLFNGLRFKDKERDRIDADYKLAMKEVDSFDERIQSQLDLNTKQGLYLEQQKLKLEADTTYQNAMNQLVQDLPGIQLPGANGMIYSYFKYGPNSPQFLAYGHGLYDYAYRSQLGSYDARVDTIYDEMYNSAAGAASGNAENEAYLSFLRQNEEWVKQYLSFKFSPDYEIFLSKLSGLIGPEYDKAAKAAESGRGMPQLKSTLPHYSDYRKMKP